MFSDDEEWNGPQGLRSGDGFFTALETTGRGPGLVVGFDVLDTNGIDAPCLRFTTPAHARAMAAALADSADQWEIVARRATGEPPKRVQWTRFLGKPPAHVKIVYRPTRWGNPYKIGCTAWRPTADGTWDKGPNLAPLTRETAIDCFRWSVVADEQMVADIRAELAGFDLGCTCRPGLACHGDVLLAVANSVGEVPRGLVSA